jgi:putative aldouronate transport system substrate-binding protein
MNNTKKTAGILIAALTALGILGGCSGNKTGGTTATTSSGGTTQSATAANDIGFHETGLPIVDTQVKLKAITMRWGSMGNTFESNAFLQQLERDSNVDIVWEVKSSSDWNEQKSLLFASRDMPDIAIGNQTFNTTDISNNRDYFIPLDDLIDKYMPNLKAAFAETPELRRASTSPDGKIYSLPARLPARPITRNMTIINKTWLDRLGLAEPQTIEDLYNVLKAFKERDANGNGDPNDEIPYTDGYKVDFLTPFGLLDCNELNLMVKDGKVVDIRAIPEYRDGIAYMARLYAEGLLDPEMFTQDDTMRNGKYQNPGVSRVGMSYQWTPDAVFGGWSSEYVAIAPIIGPDGKRYAQGDPNGVWAISGNEMSITTFCKNPEVAARWADQFYTSEATIQNFWGAIGTVIKANSDGTYELNNPPAGTSADAWYWDQSLRDFGPGYASPAFESKLKLNPESGDGFKLEIDKLTKEYVTTPFPRISYTVEELDELAILSSDITSYMDRSRAKWITEGGVTAEWDAYMTQLNRMGLDRYLAIHEGAYKRYMGN